MRQLHPNASSAWRGRFRACREGSLRGRDDRPSSARSADHDSRGVIRVSRYVPVLARSLPSRQSASDHGFRGRQPGLADGHRGYRQVFGDQAVGINTEGGIAMVGVPAFEHVGRIGDPAGMTGSVVRARQECHLST